MLTDTQIRKLPKPTKHTSLHADINGLYLKHATTGRKTWAYRSRKGGQWRVKKIGEETSRDITLTDDEIATLWVSDHAHAPLLRALILTTKSK